MNVQVSEKSNLGVPLSENANLGNSQYFQDFESVVKTYSFLRVPVPKVYFRGGFRRENGGLQGARSSKSAAKVRSPMSNILVIILRHKNINWNI